MIEKIVNGITKALYDTTSIPCYIEPDETEVTLPCFIVRTRPIKIEEASPRMRWLRIPFIITLYPEGIEPYSGTKLLSLISSISPALRFITLEDDTTISTDSVTAEIGDDNQLIIKAEYAIHVLDIKDIAKMEILTRKEINNG